MPEDPQASSDPVADYLRRLDVPDAVKAAAWDAAYSPERQHQLTALPLESSVKADLWDLGMGRPIAQAPESPSLLSRVAPMAMRVAGAPLGSVALGALGGAWAGPPGMAIGALIGGGLGSGASEVGAEALEQATGQRKGYNPTQIGLQTVLGAVPMGRMAGMTVPQLVARRGLQGVGMGAVASGLTESAETGEWPRLGTVATGSALGGLLGMGAGRLEGRARLRPLPPMPPVDVPPRPPPQKLLPLPRGTPPPPAAPDSPAIPLGGDVAPPPPPSPVSVRAAPLAYDVDPHKPAKQAVTVRQYSSDPDAVPASVVSDEDLVMLRRMATDLEAFRPARGRLTWDQRTPDTSESVYVHGTPGSPIGDDLRVLSGQHVSQITMERAIGDLLDGKPPTTKLHTAAIDAARGYRSGQYQGGPIIPDDFARPRVDEDDEFSRFAAALGDLTPSAKGEPGEAGVLRPMLAARAGGAVAGGVVGAATGDTPQERIERALLFGTAGALAPSLLARRGTAETPAKTPRPVALSPIATTKGKVARLSELVPPSSRAAMGTPRPNPLAETDAFVDRLSGGNPLLASGLRDRLAANGGFDRQRRGVLSSPEVADLSARIRVDVSRVLPPGTAGNAEATSAYTRAAHRTMARVQAFTAKVNSPQATDADVLGLAAAQAENDVVLKSLMGLRSEAGRALAAYRTFTAALSTHDLKLIRDTAGPLRGEALQLATELQGMTPIQQYQHLAAKGTATWGDTFRSYVYANMLSGVKTHERNFTGSLSSLATRLATTPVAAALDAVARPGARTVYASEVGPAAFGAIAGVEKGMRDFVFTLKHGIQPSALTDATEAGLRGKWDLPRVELRGGGKNLFNWPGRLLEATDALTGSMARNTEAYAAAWAKATREGLRGQARVTRAADLRVDQDILLGAREFSDEVLFRQKPGPITSAAQVLQQKTRVGFIVVPFIKIVANISREGGRLSPVGFAMQGVRAGGRRGAQAQGAATLGTALLAPLVWLAATGRLSGSGPRDPAKRAELMESGWRPNSVKIGDAWREVALFQPVSVPAMVVANAVEAYQEGIAKDPTTLAVDIVRRAGKTVLDQSFVSGLSDLFEAINDEGGGARFAGRALHTLTPLAGLQRTVTQAMDPVVRQPKTVLDTVKSNIPGLSTSVPPRLTRFGEPTVRPPGNAFNPLNTSPVQHDPVSEELQRLGIRLGLPSATLTVPEGVAVDELSVRQARGRGVRLALERAIRHPAYGQRSDAQKLAFVKKLIDTTQRRTSDQIRRKTIAASRRPQP